MLSEELLWFFRPHPYIPTYCFQTRDNIWELRLFSTSWGSAFMRIHWVNCGFSGWTKREKKCAFLTWLANKHDRQQKRRKKGRSQCLLFEGTKSKQYWMAFSQKHPMLGALSIVTSERKEISRIGTRKPKVTINSHDKKKPNSKPKNYSHNGKREPEHASLKPQPAAPPCAGSQNLLGLKGSVGGGDMKAWC